MQTEYLTFIILGLVYIILQDRAQALQHLGRFGDAYEKIWLWIRTKGYSIIRDEKELNDAWATHTLIMLLTASHLLALSLGYDTIIQQYAFIPAYANEAWRWITHIFLHALTPIELAPFSLHLLANIVYLYVFGDNVEEYLRRFKYEKLGTSINIYASLFIIYGVIAAAIQATLLGWSSTAIMVGASGAISGIMGLYIILFPDSQVYIGGKGPVPAYLFAALWLIAQAANQDPAIASGAHIAGFMAGAVTAFILRRVTGEWRTDTPNSSSE